MNELEFLAGLRAMPLHPGARGLVDDCAVIEFGSETLILTHDMMAEGTHFEPKASMADVAWKLVAMNLSDLASKGAEPVGALVGVSLGRDDAGFLSGLREALSVYNVPLLGGDTIAATGPSTFGITAVGRATHKPVPSRKGSKAGDALYVTGIVGRAMLGFEGHPQHLDAFNRPQPRLGEGRSLAPLASAMMDISDGLLLDGWRMASASAVTFRLNPETIPVADTARMDECLRWGDDYELLFTADPNRDLPVPATRIGTVEPEANAPIFLGGTALTEPGSLGYRHG
ncbi:MAG: thiamine-phosphate kinase [Erythrobacter sp.]|uniref:thiamine-phosphate kinase n=1 Tax=Erythrobacter sp. TaxID=1042 RepID=UPI002634A1C6|nr:thiamine-phosphate kinase [Erythrobacter sp.]MDJ0977025.1 thiamine-phosphate kinase [Erythrobacter sp.]